MRKMGALRIAMPITAGTFIIGWLAIAGVPPFAGFWSKDEILLFALASSPALYVVGLVTALLTAYYMTRQVIMVFLGTARWESHAEDHGAHGEFKPHESSPIMLLPLVVLAGLSAVMGIIQLPSFSWIPKDLQYRLERWLHPIVSFGEAQISESSAYANKGWFAFLAVAIALSGVALAHLVYQKRSLPIVEPQIMADGWRYDSTISDFMGGPGRRSFEGMVALDEKVVDGAVNGSASLVRLVSGQLRRGQTGFVRNYAAVIGIGVVVMLLWFVVGRGVL